jgi:hypothetical protein
MNVDEKYIRVAILEAQQSELIYAIGSGLYNELDTQITTQSLTPLNTTLLNSYIIPALRYWTVKELIPYTNVKLTNKGAISKNSDNSTGVSTNELNVLLQKTEKKATHYAMQLRKYLLQNNTSYPLFLNPGNDITTIYPRDISFESGIWLGGGKKVPRIEKLKWPLYYGTNESE